MCDIKTFNGTKYISEKDIFRIVNRKVRTKRGKAMSKEKVANYESSGLKIKNEMYYELLLEFDTCYHNSVIVKVLPPSK